VGSSSPASNSNSPSHSHSHADLNNHNRKPSSSASALSPDSNHSRDDSFLSLDAAPSPSSSPVTKARHPPPGTRRGVSSSHASRAATAVVAAATSPTGNEQQPQQQENSFEEGSLSLAEPATTLSPNPTAKRILTPSSSRSKNQLEDSHAGSYGLDDDFEEIEDEVDMDELSVGAVSDDSSPYMPSALENSTEDADAHAYAHAHVHVGSDSDLPPVRSKNAFGAALESPPSRSEGAGRAGRAGAAFATGPSISPGDRGALDSSAEMETNSMSDAFSPAASSGGRSPQGGGSGSGSFSPQSASSSPDASNNPRALGVGRMGRPGTSGWGGSALAGAGATSAPAPTMQDMSEDLSNSVTSEDLSALNTSSFDTDTQFSVQEGSVASGEELNRSFDFVARPML
jgi:hypothetical protein